MPDPHSLVWRTIYAATHKNDKKASATSAFAQAVGVLQGIPFLFLLMMIGYVSGIGLENSEFLI